MPALRPHRPSWPRFLIVLKLLDSRLIFFASLWIGLLLAVGSPPKSDTFGSSAALTGNNVLIGAFGDDTNGGNSGQANLFDAITGNLLQTFNDPTPTGADQFGFSVALSANNVLIGARLDDTIGSNIGQPHLFSVEGTGPAVPEPGILALFAVGLAGLAAPQRRRTVRVWQTGVPSPVPAVACGDASVAATCYGTGKAWRNRDTESLPAVRAAGNL